MPKFEVHCKECKDKLGEEFDYVHRWLDELFLIYGPDHRDIRHHIDGIEEVRKTWGDKAAEAAELHIKLDCHGKIPTMQEIEIRKVFGPAREKYKN